MKRLLCVLMVLVMAVLLVPTAGANASYSGTIKCSPTNGGSINGAPALVEEGEGEEGKYYIIKSWNLTATPAQGWEFVKWTVSGIKYGPNDVRTPPTTNTWTAMADHDVILNGDLEIIAYLEKPTLNQIRNLLW